MNNKNFNCPRCPKHFGTFPELISHLFNNPECSGTAQLAFAKVGLTIEDYDNYFGRKL